MSPTVWHPALNHAGVDGGWQPHRMDEEEASFYGNVGKELSDVRLHSAQAGTRLKASVKSGLLRLAMCTNRPHAKHETEVTSELNLYSNGFMPSNRHCIGHGCASVTHTLVRNGRMDGQILAALHTAGHRQSPAFGELCSSPVQV
ncbi:hypothetical protein JZ751_027808 [Albula glossodonta]|uniref:Uncharacterized protein n=1 Tax=Albula glossodonta TaxID=121402 RepID=A0A8T2P9Z9_9TELE|nr:hypothetical protein JZ751_027808 [Albula glossodonta]